MRIRHLLLALALVALGAPASPGFAAESPLHAHPWLPGGKPGKARASLSGESATLRNDVLEVRWELPRLRLRNVAEPGGALLIPGPVDAFRMRVDGRDCRSSSMRMNDPPRIVKLRAEPGAVNWGGAISRHGNLHFTGRSVRRLQGPLAGRTP